MAEEFVIDAQYPITMINMRGSVVDGMRVLFRSLPSNTNAQVDLELANYSAENVRSQVLFLRKQIEDVHAL